jgi:hypothetical protein
MRTTLLVNCLAASVLALHSAAAPADDRDHSKRNTIEGAWDVVVTLRVPAEDCRTAAPVTVGSNPFPSFNTFHKGGTMSEYGTRNVPASRTSGHGVWRRAGKDEFVYRLSFFSFDSVNGILVARMDIRSNLTLSDDGQTFEGVSRFVRTNFGSTVQNFCATLAGTRMSL